METLRLLAPAADLLTRGLRSRLLRGGGLVLAAGVVSGLMNFGAIVLLVRHLGPEAFGVVSLAIVTMQLVGALSNGGLNETLMTFVSRADAAGRQTEVADSLSAIFRLRLVAAFTVLVSGLLLARPIAHVIFGKPDLTLPLLLGFVGGCGVSLSQFSLAFLRATRAFGRYAVVTLFRSGVVFGGVALLAALWRLDLWTSLIVNVVAPYAAFAAGLRVASSPARRNGGVSIPVMLRIWGFSKWIMVSDLCGILFNGRLQIYLLAAFASAAEVGIYGAGFKLAAGLGLLQLATRDVLFPEISRRWASPSLGSFVRRCVVSLLILSTIVGGFGMAASWLIVPLFGRQYADSVAIFRILLGVQAARLPLMPLSMLFFATDRTRAGAVFNALELIVLAASGTFLIPRYGAFGAAWSQVLVLLAGALYLAVFARRLLIVPRTPVGGRVSDRSRW